ncbi:MAG: hypothetical protein ABSC57_10720 [Syntrophales bacterium]
MTGNRYLCSLGREDRSAKARLALTEYDAPGTAWRMPLRLDYFHHEYDNVSMKWWKRMPIAPEWVEEKYGLTPGAQI